MSVNIQILHAAPEHLDAVVELFDAYRVWYGTPSDKDGARSFLSQRQRQNESVIFLALLDGQPAGFTQLYPMFSSVSMGTTWVLNDLFVAEFARRNGIGTLLLETAAEFGRETGALRMELQTEITNTAAQKVYERHGWKKDEQFCYYSLPLDLGDSP